VNADTVAMPQFPEYPFAVAVTLAPTTGREVDPFSTLMNAPPGCPGEMHRLLLDVALVAVWEEVTSWVAVEVEDVVEEPPGFGYRVLGDALSVTVFVTVRVPEAKIAAAMTMPMAIRV
jgi:hypothetical protein